MFHGPELDEAARLLSGIIQTYPHLRDLHRVLHDIVFGADGDLVRFRKLVDLAQQDWRDLIMATEYALVDGKIVRKKGFRVYEP